MYSTVVIIKKGFFYEKKANSFSNIQKKYYYSLYLRRFLPEKIYAKKTVALF